VILELLQNAVDHGFPEGSKGGSVVVSLGRTVENQLAVKVIDNGRGLKPDFDMTKVTGLGLSIVRTLVTTELAGTIHYRAARVDDSTKELKISVDGEGTVVDLVIPVSGD
ncbi:MAG: sensor histidine kinase, partial [Actinobacteria bacterium]|nr:sensor histidine kinase [Actinomycetota bacterium]